MELHAIAQTHEKSEFDENLRILEIVLSILTNKFDDFFCFSAVGPIEIDELNRQRAEEKAMNLAANMASAIKGPVVCDSFGFVTAQVR